ncbi:MAG: dynamin family protein [Ruminococcus sp.]|nr:dynamin family protein [Ruminococcus sp.]
MENFNEVRRKYSDMLKRQSDGINEILNTAKGSELISLSVHDELKSIKTSAERLKRKLDSNEFEIAIVGLEKAGKSTFANALMGNDILPTKDERCTYTSTSICYGEKDEAVVEFFGKDEFDRDFSEKISRLGIDTQQTFEEWTEEKFNKCLSEHGEYSPEYSNLISDIRDIFKYKDRIEYFLGNSKRTFSESEFANELKGYIEDPEKAIAVKQITILSTKFERMKNAVIYDVPGFDSPTQMHKDQTMAKMKQADAIILVAAADKPSFNDSLVKFFSNVTIDDDNVKISDKTFIFANRADCAATLEENKAKIRSELEIYRIMNPSYINKRLIAGSAKARIDKENGNENSPALTGIKAKGITDGIGEMQSVLEDYNNTERLRVLSEKVNNLAQRIHGIMNELKEQNNAALSAKDEFDEALNELISSAPHNVKESLNRCNGKIKAKFSSEKTITVKVCEKIISGISAINYSITDDEIDRERYSSESGIENKRSRIDEGIRQKKYNKIYKDFIKNVLELAVEEHDECNKLIKKAFMDGLKISEANRYFEEISENVSKFIETHKTGSEPEGYYSSLIRRYSRDLFEILIVCPYGKEDRYVKFCEEKMNFYSLSLFGEDYDQSVLPGRQPMHSQILFHTDPSGKDEDILSSALIYVEKIIGEVILVNNKLYRIIADFAEKYKKDTLNRLNELLGHYKPVSADKQFEPAIYPQETPLKEQIYKTLENDIKSEDIHPVSNEITEVEYRNYFESNECGKNIKEELAEDLRVLHDILNNQVMKAISIETPFIDLVDDDIRGIVKGVDGDANSDFIGFIRDNAEKLLADKAEQAIKDREKREKQRKILEEISEIQETIPTN